MLHTRLSGHLRRKLVTVLGVATVAAAVLTSAGWASAASPSPTTPAPQPLTAQAWSASMHQTTTPSKGCFTAAYPTVAWKSVACATAPNRPYPPRITAAGTIPASESGASPVIVGGLGTGPGTGPISSPVSGLGPHTVGNGIDYSAGVTGVMQWATGSFPSVSGVTSETGIGGANSYSLQLNTKPFTTTVCAGHPGCLGWEQFLYSNQGFVFIQFWLLSYNATCPTGWNTYSLGSSTYCWRNGSASPVTPQPITSLGNLQLSGKAVASGLDTAWIDLGGGSGPSISAATSDSILNLSADWAAVEFAVVGDGGGSSANFNAGSTITVQTTTHNGTTAAPTCLYEGYTGETNNLSLVGTPAIGIGASPNIQDVQSNVASSPPSCSSAAGWGDTHITTFGGLMYDNQYRGKVRDLVSQTMNIEANQVSGAPSWPNAAVNNTVATQMGSDRIALCQQSRLVVDNVTTPIADGQTIALPTGNKISRLGNIYIVTDPGGDSMQATVYGNHIDLVAGMGNSSEPVSGLFANAPGNPTQLVTGTGTILNTPIDFSTMYNVYVPSWRVAPSDTLLSSCDTATESPLPTAPFWAGSLPTSLYNQSRAVCQRVGVQDGSLLDACTLDVAVLGDSSAANVYIGKKAPVAIGFK